MKKNSFALGMCALLCSMFVLAGCENRMPSPPSYVVVMKMKKPEYKDKALVNYHDGDSAMVGMRFNNYGEPAGKSGYSPYWELPDNWLLVDWKWRNFPYNAGLTLLTEVSWDKYPTFSELPLPTWPLSEPHVFQPVESILSISGEKLAEYSQDKLIEGSILGMMRCVFKDEPNIVEKGDSVWSIVHAYLTNAIKNGDMETLQK